MSEYCLNIKLRQRDHIYIEKNVINWIYKYKLTSH